MRHILLITGILTILFSMASAVVLMLVIFDKIYFPYHFYKVIIFCVIVLPSYGFKILKQEKNNILPGS